MATLTFILDDGQEIVVPLNELVSVGRNDGNDVLVDDPRISARHAEIKRVEGGVYEVQDLTSRLGTFVNGERISRKHLTTGDKVDFGPLKSIFDLADPPSSPSETAAPVAAEFKPIAEKSSETPSVKKKKKKLEPVPAGEPPEKTASAPVAGTKNAASIPPPEKAVPVEPVALSPPVPAQPSPEIIAAAVQEALEKIPATEREAIEQLKTAHIEAQNKLDALGEELGVLSKQRADAHALGLREKKQLEEQLAAASATLAQEKQQLQEVLSTRAAAEAHYKELTATLRKLTDELGAKDASLKDLSGKESHLNGVLAGMAEKHSQRTAALRETEARRSQLIEDHTSLTREYDAKHAEWQRVTAAAEVALHELQTMSAHKDNTVAHLQSLVQQTETLDARLKDLHQENAGMDARVRDLQTLAEAREDQIKSAEKKLQSLDGERARLQQSIADLSGVEEKLKATQDRHREAETRHAELSTRLEELGGHRERAEKLSVDLETRIAALRDEHDRNQQAASEAKEARERVEEHLQRIHAEREAHENDLATTRRDLAAEHQHLDEAQAHHAALQQKCAELADTDNLLAASKKSLSEHESGLAKIQGNISDLSDKHAAQSHALDALHGEEEATKGRLEVLRGREKDLRDALTELSEREREQRGRFEEIRKLATEAEHEHTTRGDELQRGLELSRRELADLEVRLAPLRDWKDAMDKRYARLAALPEDSTEARELWREIESEKANLKNLITQGAGQTRSVSLREAVLKNLTREGAAEPKSGRNGAGRNKGTLHAPPSLSEQADTPEERANVGHTGTGALISGTGQEMALKARLNRLRESVQREAMRLEFLRQERAREEARGKPGATTQPLMREHDRQLETKVRREEEQLATTQRKIEMAEVEEERRREKIAEMELKITELKSNIAEAERQRSTIRHQTDLAQTELRNYEAAVDRVKKMTE